MSKKGRKSRSLAKRSRDSKAKELLKNKAGFLLEPSIEPDKKQIRKELIKALRSEGWKSKYSTRSERKKLYDEWTEKIATIQKQKNLDGRTIRSINIINNDWRRSKEFKRLTAPIPDTANVDTPFVNNENMFEWMTTVDFLEQSHPDFEYEVSIPHGSQFWKGSYSDIAKNKTNITAAAKAFGSNFGGYKVQIDYANKVVRITFTEKK